MTARGATGQEEQVVVWAPTGRDGPLTRDLLAAQGLKARVCADRAAFLAALAADAGVALVADEALAEPGALEAVSDALRRQPPWSDILVVIFTREVQPLEPAAAQLGALANVTTLERPAHLPTLFGIVQAGLRARRRQYEVRDLLSSLADTHRRKDEFLAMLGHELRNPLSAIAMASHLLGRAPADPQLVDRQRALIDRQVGSLTRIVEDLLDVTRISRGTVSLRRERVDLNDVARRAHQTLAPSLGERRVEVVASAAPAIVDGDPVRLEQVVANLVHNASKFTRPGGLVRITVRDGAERHALAVTDDGEGIPAAQLERIFEVFAQIDPSIDRSRGGLGLGLPLARGLVELHGGTLRASSDGPGRGATFELELPAATAAGAAAGPTGAAPAERGRLRVLVVEDNADLREGLKDLLEGCGFDVDAAVDGQQGLERFLAHPPDVALIDIGLPIMDGYELARRLRAAGAKGRLLALTGYGQASDRERAVEAGFSRHLVKPVRVDELLAALGAR